MKLFLVTLAVALISSLANAQHSVALSWQAGTGGGTPTSFNAYRTQTTGGCATVTATGCSKVGTSTVTTFTDTTVIGGATYFYVVTAVNATGSSGPSNQVQAVIPSDAPNAPTGLTVTGVQ